MACGVGHSNQSVHVTGLPVGHKHVFGDVQFPPVAIRLWEQVVVVQFGLKVTTCVRKAVRRLRSSAVLAITLTSRGATGLQCLP